MSESRKMLDAVHEDWVLACDGRDQDMCAWAVKWGNPLMYALARRVLNGELQKQLEQAEAEVKVLRARLADGIIK